MDHYSLSSVLDALESFKQEKWIEKILSSIKKKIFWNNLNDSNIDEFKYFVREFYSLYYLMKNKFSQKYRTTWERYFEHLREVVNNVLDLPNPNTDKVLIAIAHDSIEDTNKTYESLEEDYWYKIALWVKAISKNPWEDYIDDKYDGSEEAITIVKNKRNDEYFSHLSSFDEMSEYINWIAHSKWIKLSDEELIEITKNTLDVKFADRMHNLSTQWDPNDLHRVRKKLDETKKYFLKIAEEVNPVAFMKLQSLILQLEIKLHGVNIKTENIVNS